MSKNLNSWKIEKIGRDSLFTSSEVGDLLQVNASSVNKWIEQGRLSAFRTPGGHRRVRAGDLVAFLETHQMPIPQPLRSASRPRLLIVDDDKTQLDALVRLMSARKEDVDVLGVDNGIDALVQVGSFRPHLILLDVFMPEIDGLEVCRRLKANPQTSDIEVVMTSGSFSKETEASALAAGASNCLPKPIKAQQLFDLIERRLTA